jgi:hypothetical protein
MRYLSLKEKFLYLSKKSEDVLIMSVVSLLISMVIGKFFSCSIFLSFSSISSFIIKSISDSNKSIFI